MLIRIEPKDFNMFSVYLVFNKQAPDLEDADVRRYLADHGLSPKRQWDEPWQGVDCHMMSFGGCYIQDHLKPIGEIHRRGVQQALLRRRIDRALSDRRAAKVREALATLEPAHAEKAKASLVERLNVEASFGTDKEGCLAVTVPAARIRQDFLEVLRITPPHPPEADGEGSGVRRTQNDSSHHPRTRFVAHPTNPSGTNRAANAAAQASGPTV